jgi:hypothetical protein
MANVAVLGAETVGTPAAYETKDTFGWCAPRRNYYSHNTVLI